jgi:hypothetical protein
MGKQENSHREAKDWHEWGGEGGGEGGGGGEC